MQTLPEELVFFINQSVFICRKNNLFIFKFDSNATKAK